MSPKSARLCSLPQWMAAKCGRDPWINGDSITVDFNHPLAGQTVHFDVDVLEVEPALEGMHADPVG